MDYEQRQDQTATEYEERDASNRPERAINLIKFLDRTKGFETFHNVNVQNISFEQFELYILRINGILRDLPVYERRFDGSNTMLRGMIIGTALTPKYEDKEGLLKEAFELSKKISNTDRAYMLSAVINSVHMFKDGNGRTSRTLFLLQTIQDKETFYATLKKALGPDGRFETYDINPNQIDFEIQRYILQTLHGWSIGSDGRLSRHIHLRGGIAMTEYSQIDKTNQEYVENIRKFRAIADTDFYYIMTAIIETLTPDQYDGILLRDRWLSPIKMASLSDETWKDFFEAYYKLKKDHVRTLIDVFINSEKYKSPEKEGETMKVLFKRRINEEFDRWNKSQ